VRSDKVYGADLAIFDNYYEGGINYGLQSLGDNVCHQDNYYNVAFFDYSVSPIIDKDLKLEIDLASYAYWTHWPLIFIQEIADGV